MNNHCFSIREKRSLLRWSATLSIEHERTNCGSSPRPLIVLSFLAAAFELCRPSAAAAQYVTLTITGTITQDELGTNPKLVGKPYTLSTSFNGAQLADACPGTPTDNEVCAQTSNNPAAAVTTLIIGGAPNIISYRSDYSSMFSLFAIQGVDSAINAQVSSQQGAGGNYNIYFATQNLQFSIPVSFAQTIVPPYIITSDDATNIFFDGFWNPGPDGVSEPYAFGASMASISLATAPGPRIIFSDPISESDIDVTGLTQTVAAGEQIQLGILGADPSQSQPWMLPNSQPIGGYLIAGSPLTKCNAENALCTPGTVAPADFSDAAAATFYWYVPSNANTVTYTGNGGSVTAAFNVEGPTNANMAATPGAISIFEKAPKHWYLICGNPDVLPACIELTPSADIPTGRSNKDEFQFVQLIDRDEIFRIRNGKSHDNCIYKLGPLGSFDLLDNNYPYNTGGAQEFTDNPDAELPSAYTEVDDYFSARVFLEWNANLPHGRSIPVPLGYTDWLWQASAYQNGGVWTTPQQGMPPTIGGFQASTQYPTWDGVALNKPACTIQK